MAPLLIDKDGVRIVIQAREHLPPHIHASYGDDEALIDIRSGNILQGFIPKKKLKVVQEWLNEAKNKEVVEQNFFELNPRLKLEKDSQTPLDSKRSSKNKSKKGDK